MSFLLTEGRDRVGGNITTLSNEEGYLWEEGPNSFQPSDAMLKAAVRARLPLRILHRSCSSMPWLGKWFEQGRQLWQHCRVRHEGDTIGGVCLPGQLWIEQQHVQQQPAA